MARVREFDADAALEKAMLLFWEKGYSKTSVRDISAYTGVAHAGLYTAFEGKDGLFESALRHYANTRNSLIFGPLESANSGKAELIAFLDMLVEASQDEVFTNGCFIANTATEFANKSGSISRFVRSHFNKQLNALKNALGNAKSSGEVSINVDIDEASGLFLTTFYGISTLARAKVPLDHFKQTAAQAKKILS